MPTNRPPRFNGPPLAIAVEDDPLAGAASINLLARAFDRDPGDTLRVLSVNGVASGLVHGRFGTLVFDPTTGAASYLLDRSLPVVQRLGEGALGRERFDIVVADQAGATAGSTLFVQVEGRNDAPVAGPVRVTLTEDGPSFVATGDLLARTRDPDAGDTVSVVAVNGATASLVQGTYGRLTWDAATGAYQYVLDNASAGVQGLGADETGKDVFRFRVADSHGAQAESTLTVTVIGTNDAPDARDVSLDLGAPSGVFYGLPFQSTMQATDPDGDLVSVLGVAARGAGNSGAGSYDPFLGQTVFSGLYGTVFFNPSGTQYRVDASKPATIALGAGQKGTELLDVTFTDGHGGFVTRTLSLGVTGVNDPARIVPPAFGTVVEDVLPVALGRIVATDPDAGESAFRTPSALAGTYGTFTFNAATGDWSYRLDFSPGGGQAQFLLPGEIASDSLTVTSLDGTASAVVTVLVVGTNDIPVARPDFYRVLENQVLEVSAGFGGLADNDGGGDGLISIVTGSFASARGGQVVLLGTDGSFRYTPTTNFSGTDSFTYTLMDGNGDRVTGTATIEVIDTPNPVAAITLSTLATTGLGFRILGTAAGDGAGRSVSGIGDMNGDGRADLLIGAPNAGATDRGAAYVVLGKTGSADVLLSNVAAGNGGFVLNPAAPNGVGQTDAQFNFAYTGSAVAAGDVNGDGRPDLVVGAPGIDLPFNSNTSLPDAGKVFVLFGKTDTAAVSLTDVTGGTGGYAIVGPGFFDNGRQTGTALAVLGDLNSDLRADLVIGAPGFLFRFDPEEGNDINVGGAYVVFGKSTTSNVSLNDVGAGSGGFQIIGAASGADAGSAVASTGDVNGDGIPDFLIGAPGDSAISANSTRGSAYLVHGKVSGSTVYLDDVANGLGGFTVTGGAIGDRIGSAVAGAGDVNGDGRPDLLVGAPGTDAKGADSGAAYVVFGKTATTAVSAGSIANGIGGFRIIGESAGDLAGSSVAGIGDVNGDGRADLLIGAPNADATASNSGAAYVVFGKTGGGTVDLATIATGIGGFKLLGGPGVGDLSGISVSQAGDVNNDGRLDLLIGASGGDGGGADSGIAYVVFGQPGWVVDSVLP